MRTITDRTFQSFVDLDDDYEAPADLFQNVELHRCMFKGVAVGGFVSHPAARPIIKNVVLKDCTAYGTGCLLETAVIDNVTVENLRVGNGNVVIRGAAYRHVTIRGVCDGVSFSEFIALPEEKSRVQRFRAANAAFYKDVDWALDISKAEFFSCRIICDLPVRLIRRDPETQAIVRRDKLIAMQSVSREIGTTILAGYAPLMTMDGIDEGVVVVGTRARHFKERLKELQLLRDAGVIEPG